MKERIIDLDKLTPDQLEAEDLLGQASLMIRMEKYDSALEVLQKAQEKAPQEIDIYLRQAQIYSIMDDYDKADECLDSAAYLDKADGRIYLHRGNILFLTGKYSECIEQYGMAEELGVKIAPMYNNMGFAYERLGKPSQAQSAYGKAIRLDPDDPMYRYRRIALLLEYNEVDAADEQIADFLKRFPNIKEGYIMAVDVLFRRDEFQKAEELILSVMNDQGEDPELQALLVRTYALLKKPGEAIALGCKLLENPDMEEHVVNDVLQTVPRIYIAIGEKEKAFDLLRKTIANEKDGTHYVTARMMLMTMLSAEQRYKELLPQVEDVLSKPELAEQLFIAYMLKGHALKGLGRGAEAEAAFRDAIKKLRMVCIRNPLLVDAHVYRAMCHQGVGEYEEALEELKIVQRLDVETREFYILRSTIYAAMGKADLAEADKKKADSMQRK